MLRLWLWYSVLLLGLPVAALAQPAPCTPQNTSKTGAMVQWAPPVLDPRVTPLGYEIWQQVDTGAWAKVADAPLSPATYSVQNLAPGHTYTFGVKLVGKLNGGDPVTGPFGTPDPAVPSCLAIVTVGFPTKVSVTPQ